MPAVVGLATMGGAAVTEKSSGIGIGTQREILDLNDPGPLEPGSDIASEIEHRVPDTACRCEEPAASRVFGVKAGKKLGPNLIARLPNHGTDRGPNMVGCGAEPFHCRHRRLDDAGQSAAPAGMGSADHASSRAGKQDGATIPFRHPECH